jgi:hypothetical protein
VLLLISHRKVDHIHCDFTFKVKSCSVMLSLRWTLKLLIVPCFGQVFHKRMPPEAIDLASRLLQYSPSLRCTAVSIF